MAPAKLAKKALTFHFVLILSTLNVSPAGADISCIPTELLPKQNRTRMKHRSLPPPNVNAKIVTVADVLHWPAAHAINTPGFRRFDNELDAKELGVFVLTGHVWQINVEANDCDFHVEIGALGSTATSDRVIVEIPQGARYSNARDALLLRLSQLGITLHHETPLQTPIPIRVMGYGFFDAWHFSQNNPQRGNAHGSRFVGTLWELHPVWKIGSP